MKWAAHQQWHAEQGVDFGDGYFAVKSGVVKGATIDRDKRLVKGIISTTDIDGEGEVVLAQRFDRSYFPDRIKTVYIDHKYVSLPDRGQAGAIGVCRNMTARGNGIFSVTQVTQRAIGEDLLTAIEEEIVAGLSIGFAVTEAGPLTADEKALYGDARSIVRRGKLLEYSYCANPCNPYASVLPDDTKAALDELVTKGRIHRTSAVAFGLAEAAHVATATHGGGRRWRLLSNGDVLC
jgi:phage head maturation protease